MTKKSPTWVTNAYKTTQVHWGKTQAQLMTMLEQVGITQTRFTSLPDRFVLEFMASDDGVQIPKAVRIIVPLQTTPDDDPRTRNNELNTVHRILLNHLKAKFVAIGNGIAEFESEFMAHLVIKDKTGNDTTMGEALLPQYNKYIEGGDAPFLLDSGDK